MGRITRSTNGTSKLGSVNYRESDNGRLTLIKSSGKRGKVKKSSIEVRMNESKEDGKSDMFEFKTEVPFEYSPRQNGFGTVLEFMRRGNESVKEKILNECNLILECRVCNNLFRSPRDFVTHKDKYCSEKYERLSPAGLTELLRLAHESFKINETSSSSVSLLPPLVSAKDYTQGDDGSDLSFDVNHLVPMLNTVLHPSAAATTTPDVYVEPMDLELNTSSAKHTKAGISRTTRQLPRAYNGEVRILEKFKSQNHDKAALVGVGGKATVVGKPSSIELIVHKLTAQLEAKDQSKKEHKRCHICQMECPSEKSLRIHVRHDHQEKKIRKKRKRKGINLFKGLTTKEMDRITLEESHKSVISASVSNISMKGRPRGRTKSGVVVRNKSEPSTAPTVIQDNDKTSVLVPASFRRLTNNSFSATLAQSPDSVPILHSLNELESAPKRPRNSKNKHNEGSRSPSISGQFSSEESAGPDYKALAKALFLSEKKGRKTVKVKNKTPPRKKQTLRKISCIKCSGEFRTEKEMSVHLGNCQGQNNTTKIGIIDRHDYMKPPAENLQEEIVVNPLLFNNNENEGEGSKRCESHSVESVQVEISHSSGAPGSGVLAQTKISRPEQALLS